MSIGACAVTVIPRGAATRDLGKGVASDSCPGSLVAALLGMTLVWNDRWELLGSVSELWWRFDPRASARGYQNEVGIAGAGRPVRGSNLAVPVLAPRRDDALGGGDDGLHAAAEVAV